MSGKESRSRREIEEMLLERCRETMDITSVNVIGDGANWHAIFRANTHLMLVFVSRFRAIVSELQAAYDVKPD